MTVKVCDLCGDKATATNGTGNVVLENPREHKHSGSYLAIEATYNIDGTVIDLCRKCRLDIFKQAVRELSRELSNYERAS